MKKYIAPALGITAAIGLFWIDEGLAANVGLIDDGDNPGGVSGSTAWGGSLRTAVIKVIDFFLFFLGIVATAMVISGGFMYMTAAGDDGKTEKAKMILVYATIGILIVLLSFALVSTVTNMGHGQRGET